MKKLLAERAAKMATADGMVKAAAAAARDLTDEEAAAVAEIIEEIKALDATIERFKASSAMIERLAGLAATEEEDNPMDDPAKSVLKPWSVKAADRIQDTVQRQSGRKDPGPLVPAGSVAVDSAVSTLAPLPATPKRLLDLIQRERLGSPSFSYLRQVSFTNAAAPVATLGKKPTSLAEWVNVEGRAVTVATMSGQLSNDWLTDYNNLIAVLSAQLEGGVLDATETLLATGDVATTQTGLLNTTGVRALSFNTDVITSIRMARLTMEEAGIPVSAVVLNPADKAALDLAREDGATGGFLLDSDGYKRIFGDGAIVASPKVIAGTALLGDFSTVRLMVRDDMSTVAFTQHKDWAEYNAFVIRAEHRLAVKISRPNSLAIVQLAAAPGGGG